MSGGDARAPWLACQREAMRFLLGGFKPWGSGRISPSVVLLLFLSHSFPPLWIDKLSVVGLGWVFSQALMSWFAA